MRRLERRGGRFCVPVFALVEPRCYPAAKRVAVGALRCRCENQAHDHTYWREDTRYFTHTSYRLQVNRRIANFAKLAAPQAGCAVLERECISYPARTPGQDRREPLSRGVRSRRSELLPLRWVDLDTTAGTVAGFRTGRIRISGASVSRRRSGYRVAAAGSTTGLPPTALAAASSARGQCAVGAF
jgi:hypothetical protein